MPECRDGRRDKSKCDKVKSIASAIAVATHGGSASAEGWEAGAHSPLVNKGISICLSQEARSAGEKAETRTLTAQSTHGTHQ
jgi:hypothetical protein